MAYRRYDVSVDQNVQGPDINECFFMFTVISNDLQTFKLGMNHDLGTPDKCSVLAEIGDGPKGLIYIGQSEHLSRS